MKQYKVYKMLQTASNHFSGFGKIFILLVTINELISLFVFNEIAHYFNELKLEVN